MNKKLKITIALALLSLGGITAYYNYEMENLKVKDRVQVVVAKEDLKEGTIVSESNTTLEKRDSNSLVKGYYTDPYKVYGTKLNENVQANQELSEFNTLNKEELKKQDLRLVSIKGFEPKQDSFTAYSIHPKDKVDLYFFDKNGVMEKEPVLTEVLVEDLVNADGISYKNKTEAFKPTYATLWVNKEQLEDIHQKQELGGYFKLVPYQV